MHPGALLRWVAAVAAMEVSLAATALSAPIGEAASVVPASNYTRNGAPEKPLAIRDTLEQNDRIRTTEGGSTRVRLLDDTMITIGPNSEVLLDQFVFDGNRAQKATVEVVRGAMRFVSGTSERRAYEIKTPAATIGVRGTVVDIGFVNGRWSFNPVDGTITATLTTTGETRSFSAGQPGFTVGPSGFTPLNPNDASQLWRRLDTAHQQLAKASGTNPSAPQGAAAGNQGNADVTGSAPAGGQQGQGGQGQQGAGGAGGPGSGGPGTGGTGGQPYSAPPPINITQTTGSPTGGAAPIPTSYADLNAIITAGTGVLGATGSGPFNSSINPLNIAIISTELPIEPVVDTESFRLNLDAATAAWNQGSGKAFRAGTIAPTTPVASDPDRVSFGRVTATVSELYTDPSSEPLYQIGRWTNGVIGYQHGETSGNVTLSANQGIHYIAYGYSGGLVNPNGPITGQTVTYALESATKPTWSDGRSAPGTFTGSLAVLFETSAVHYGMTGTINMSEGSYNVTTAGGTANPLASGASTSTSGTGATAQLTVTGANCTSCWGAAEFLNVASNKVGVVYFVSPDSESESSINGAAVFGVAPPSAVPNFTTNPMSILAVGGTQNVLEVDVAPNLNRAFAELSALEFDPSTGALKSVTLKGTGVGVTDPNALTLTRDTATVSELYTDPSSTPLYQIGRWTNGRIVGTQNSQTVIDETMTANQGLHYIIFGHTNGLFDSGTNQFQFGKVVTYSLESATKPTWINGQSAPGTFSGQLAVAFGTTAVSYGLQATLNMGSADVISMQTPGGIIDPHLSGAIGFVSGGTQRSAYTLVTGTGGSCDTSDCFGIVNFVPVASNKVGVFYAMDVTNESNSNMIEGAAVFGNPGTPAAHASAYAKPVGSFADAQGILHVAGNVQGVADVSGSTATIRSFTDGLENVVRLTAQVADGRTHDFIAWERWTNGTYVVNGDTTVTLPANGGVHMIHGLGGTMPFTPSGGPGTTTSVQYSLAGGTLPTLSTGITVPGTLGSGSKLGIDFNSQKIGVDLFVNIGTGGYLLSTTGGATTPATSSITFNSDGIFLGGLNVALNTGTEIAACTSAGDCSGGVAGFFSGLESTSIGLTYSFGNDNTAFVSGAAAFGRVFPASTIGAFGYADATTSANNQLLTGRLMDFNTSAEDVNNLAIVPDSAKPATGLSVSAFNLEVSTPNYGWHRIGGSPNGYSVDQGVIAGVLGWERLTGTLHQHTSGGGGDPITLSSSQGVHVLHGVAATNIPTNATYTYNLVGGTSPTIADGSVTPGTLASGQVGINFSSTAPKFGVDLNVNMGASGGTYSVASSGGAAAPSVAAPSLHSSGTFGTTALNQVVATHTGGTNAACSGASCSASVNGFLAGDQAKHLGIVYQFGNASAGKVVTGAAGFSR